MVLIEMRSQVRTTAERSDSSGSFVLGHPHGALVILLAPPALRDRVLGLTDGVTTGSWGSTNAHRTPSRVIVNPRWWVSAVARWKRC